MSEHTSEKNTAADEALSLHIHHEVFGAPKKHQASLILLHGWNNSVDVIRPFAETLGNFFEVIAVDLPGHGKSEIPEHIWSMKDFANAFKNFLDKKGITEAYMVGHSFGGKTLIQFSSMYPNYVKKLVLIGSSGFRPTPSLRKRLYFGYLKFLRNFIRFKNTKLGMKLYENWYIPKYASRDYKAAGSLTKTFVKTLNEELYDEIQTIHCPSLLIWGSKDDESPPELGRKMHAYIQGSKYIELEGRDHYPFLGNGAPLVSKYIRDFLGE